MPSLPTTYVIFTPSLVPLHIEATNISMKSHLIIIMDVHGIVYLAMVGSTSWNGTLQLNIHLAKRFELCKTQGLKS